MSKLVACGSCDNQISNLAASCPRCGAPGPAAQRYVSAPVMIAAPQKKKSSAGGVILLVLIGLGVVGAMSNRDKKRKEQDAVAAASPSSSSSSSAAAEAIVVSADQLHAAYKQNEVAADNQYRDKVLRVTGAVQAVKKDIMDDAYMTLWTDNRFESVRAHFESEGDLGRVSPGQHVTIRCIGNNVVLGSPELKDCVLE